MEILKNVAIPRIKLTGDYGDLALYGGVLYVKDTPVQSYFSKNVFYWENDDEKCALYLYDNGLFGEVRVLREGIVFSYKAGTQLCYVFEDPKNSNNKDYMKLYFGMMPDSKGTSRYYCGLVKDKKTVISIPSGEGDELDTALKNNNRQFTVSCTDKGYLQIDIVPDDESDGSEFAISKLTAVFDASYSTCAATLYETQVDAAQYALDLDISITDGDTPSGKCTASYTENSGEEHTFTVNFASICKSSSSACEASDSGLHYYCGIIYDGKEVVKMPVSDNDKRDQELIFVTKGMSGVWNISTANKNIEISKEKQIALNMTNSKSKNMVSKVTENNTVTNITNGLQGKIELSQALKNRDRMFCANAVIMGKLKQNYNDLLSNCPGIKALSVDELFGLDMPKATQVVDENGKTITIDGQAECQRYSHEMLKNVAMYYSADVKSSDNAISYEDLYGFTKDKARSVIDDRVISAIEALPDDEKADMKDFLKKYSDIQLSEGYGGSTNEYIKKGFASVDAPVRRCQYYMQDDHEGSLNQDKNYRRLMTIIDKYTYLTKVDGLQAYVNDTNGNWAEKLYYSACTKIVMLKLNNLVSSNKLTHICKMLAVLDSDEHEILQSSGGSPVLDDNGNKIMLPYAAALYAQVMEMSLASIIDSFSGIPADDDYMKTLELLFGTLYENMTGDNKDMNIPQELFTDMAQYLSEEKAIAVDDMIFAAQEFMQLAGQYTSFTSMIQKYGEETNGVNKCMACISYIFFSMQFASVFCDWNSLSDAQKAESVMSCVYAVVGTAREGMIWSSVKKLMSSSTPKNERIEAAFRLRCGGEDFDFVRENIAWNSCDGEKNFSEAMSNRAKRYSTEITGTDDVRLTAVSKAFRIGEFAFQVLNVVLLAYAFVMQAIDVDKMFKNNSPDIAKALAVMDSILMGVALVAGVVEFATMFLTTEVASAVMSVVPIVGAACMILSAIISIVQIIIMDKNPESPLQKIIEEQLVPTVKKLEKPASDWNGVTVCAV